MNNKTDELLSRLSGVRNTGDGKWLARCPGHDDKSPSLAVRDAGGKILIHCFAGCDFQMVLASVGLTAEDLFPDEPKGSREGRGYQAPVPRIVNSDTGQLLMDKAQLIYVAMRDIKLGKALSNKDWAAVDSAMATIDGIKRSLARGY